MSVNMMRSTWKKHKIKDNDRGCDPWRKEDNMIFKVYGQNITRARGTAISIIDPKEVNDYISNQANDFFNGSDLSFLPHNEDDEIEDEIFNKACEAVYELIDEIWSKDKILFCGDFMIVEADEAPSRPSMCGDSYGDLKEADILKKMKI